MPRLDRDDEIAPTLVRVGAYLCSGVLALMDAPGSHVEPGVPRSGSPRGGWDRYPTSISGVSDDADPVVAEVRLDVDLVAGGDAGEDPGGRVTTMVPPGLPVASGPARRTRYHCGDPRPSGEVQPAGGV